MIRSFRTSAILVLFFGFLGLLAWLGSNGASQDQTDAPGLNVESYPYTSHRQYEVGSSRSWFIDGAAPYLKSSTPSSLRRLSLVKRRMEDFGGFDIDLGVDGGGGGDNQGGDDQAGDDQAGDDQAGDDQAGDDQADDDQAGDDQADDDQAGDDQVGDDQVGDDQVGDDQVGDDQVGDDQAGDDQAGDDQAGDDQAGDDQAGDDQAGDDQAGGDNGAGDDPNSTGGNDGTSDFSDNPTGEETSGGFDNSAGEETGGGFDNPNGDESTGGFDNPTSVPGNDFTDNTPSEETNEGGNESGGGFVVTQAPTPYIPDETDANTFFGDDPMDNDTPGGSTGDIDNTPSNGEDGGSTTGGNNNQNDLINKWKNGDATLSDLEQRGIEVAEDPNVWIAAVVLSVVGFFFLLFVAHQMVENPHGCIAKFFRCLVAIFRIICYPCRRLCCCCCPGSQQRRARGRGGRTGVPMDDDEGYSRDLELT